MLKQVFGGKAMSRTQTHEWYRFLKRSELQLRTINIQDNLQQQEMKKTSKKFGK